MGVTSAASMAAWFDERAATWDDVAGTASPVQGAVAALAGVRDGSRVLDLGCGTGVMVPHYLEAGAAFVLGVDVSTAMVEGARAKFADNARVSFLAADVCDLPALGVGLFDAVVIYNAYPHFLDREALIRALAMLMGPHARLVVAHGTGRAGINAHHAAQAAGVSIGLGSARNEARVWEPLLLIDALVDTPSFYAFAGAVRG